MTNEISEYAADEVGAHSGPGTAVIFYSCCGLRGLKVVEREEVMPDNGESKEEEEKGPTAA
jgi:hypothetical protein